jgi:hypothetical protein
MAPPRERNRKQSLPEYANAGLFGTFSIMIDRSEENDGEHTLYAPSPVYMA